jgi:hypothetical protein
LEDDDPGPFFDSSFRVSVTLTEGRRSDGSRKEKNRSVGTFFKAAYVEIRMDLSPPNLV